MTLQLLVRSFSFSLLQPLRTATGVVAKRRGWLLRLCDGDTGAVGWGEVAPLRTEQWLHCKILMGALPEEVSRHQLEVLIHQGPGAFGFGLGSALAELDGLVGDLSSQPWQEAPPPAHLLPAGDQMLMALDQVLMDCPSSHSLTFKWKVATEASEREQRWLEQLLVRLPRNAGCGWMPMAGGTALPQEFGWSGCGRSRGLIGWSSHWRLITTKGSSNWPNAGRWPSMNHLSVDPSSVTAGWGGRCGALR